METALETMLQLTTVDRNTHSYTHNASTYHHAETYVEILEQPAPHRHTFRYKCEILEGRSARAILGIHSTAESTTYPTIKVVNYQGPYILVVSCVTKDGPPHRPHPHKLLGENCKNGIFTEKVENPNMTYSFTGLRIQRVRKKDVEESLQHRRGCNVDPFRTGFSNPDGGYNFSVLRLCFQVFICTSDNFCVPLSPVVSEPIQDKKAVMGNLTIMKLSHCSAPAVGGTEVILLCDRISKEDIQIWFYEEQDSKIVWEAEAKFQPTDVHKHVAISFRTPPYHNVNISHPVEVSVQLRKTGYEAEWGDPRPFQFFPMSKDPDPCRPRRKVPKMEKVIEFLKHLQVPEDFNTGGCQFPAEFTSRIAVPRMQGQQNIQYEGLLNAENNSIPRAPTSYAESRTPVMMPQIKSVTDPSASFGQTSASSTFIESHEAHRQSLGFFTADNNSFPQASTSFAESRTPTVTPQVQPAADPCSSFQQTQLPSSAFILSHETRNQALGCFSAENNSFPQAPSSFGESRTSALPEAHSQSLGRCSVENNSFSQSSVSFAESRTLTSTSSAQAVAGPSISFQKTPVHSGVFFVSPEALSQSLGFLPAENNPFLQTSTAFVELRMPIFTTRIESVAGSSSSLRQTPVPSTAFAVSPEADTSSPEIFPPTTAALVHDQQFETSAINNEIETYCEQNNLSPDLLDSFSSITLDNEFASDLNINGNLFVDFLEN